MIVVGLLRLVGEKIRSSWVRTWRTKNNGTIHNSKGPCGTGVFLDCPGFELAVLFSRHIEQEAIGERSPAQSAEIHSYNTCNSLSCPTFENLLHILIGLRVPVFLGERDPFLLPRLLPVISNRSYHHQ
jgi:hypothetical protein